MLVSQTDPFYVASPLNPIFMLGDAPEAHDVLSKTPRIQLVFLKTFVPRRFRSRLATIRKLSSPFIVCRSLAQPRSYRIGTRNCQFGWLQGSQNLLKGKKIVVAGAR